MPEKTVFMTKEHGSNLPFVRIVEAELENFKSVEYGKLTFSCGKNNVPYNTKSDILGIYGQNGSGKTSFIDALDILRNLLMGAHVPSIYAECVAKGKEYAKLGFTFDFQYRDGRIRTIKYEFKMSVIEVVDKEEKIESTDPNLIKHRKSKQRVKIFDEVVSASGDFDGKKNKMQSIIDTSVSGKAFGPASKVKQFISSDVGNDLATDLLVNKKLASEKALSFIFMDETLDLFKKNGNYSSYFQVLIELNYFATFFFRVIGAKSSGFIRLGFALPIYSRAGYILVGDDGVTIASESLCDDLDSRFENMNLVLGQLIPGLSIKLKRLGPGLMKDGANGVVIDVVAIRNGTELPIRDESDGIRKIISSLSLIIAAFNDPSLTIAIDEFDAGVFEYLLGEILENFEKYGKGQFIFTSHNLRPLEVIDKDFLVFTTTNPKNRYVRMKNVSHTSNLRDRYYHEILVGEQDEELYVQAKNFKIVQAFRKAGVNGEKA